MHAVEWAPVIITTFPRKVALTDRGIAVSPHSGGPKRLHCGTSTADSPEYGVRLSSVTFMRLKPLHVPDLHSVNTRACKID